MTEVTVFTAFKNQLRALCLNEFPCGAGSWNKSRFEWRRGHLSITGSKDEDKDPGEESTDSLKELLRSSFSPWALEEDVIAEAQQLRELAVTSPQITQKTFIFLFFKSLRLVDKGVTEVDEHLLRFRNLEELTLSANKISRINSAVIPRTLKVLELCGNEITSLRELCVDPLPILQHLGLAYNRLSYPSESQYLAPCFWPSLLSLDLSFNNFMDLLGIVSKLSGLPRLRSLLLMGNPLALLPGYRGFIVDTMPQLRALDDAMISPEERHQYQGIAKLQEIIMNKAHVMVNIRKVNGLPNPSYLQDPETAPEFPVITFNYYLTYEFLSTKSSAELNIAQIDDFSPLPSMDEIQVLPVQSPSRSPEGSREQETHSVPLDPLLKEIHYHIALHKTPGKTWEETVALNYQKVHRLRDILALKSFLYRGTTVNFIEEKTLSWPVQSPEEVDTKAQSPIKAKKEKGKESKKDTKDSVKKKKKRSVLELRHDPPILKTLGSTHVSLEALMSDPHLKTVCNFEVMFPLERGRTPSPKSKASKIKSIKSKSDKDITKTIKSATSTTKGKGKSKENLEELPAQAVPLTAEFQAQLVQWLTISDALNQ